MRTAFGFLLAFALGFACRWFAIPAPAPPTLTGAALVLTITAGYLAASLLVERR